MIDIKQTIGSNLKYIRFQSGMSQEKFYEKYHLSAKYYSNVERGEVNIGVEALFTLAKLFGTTPADLVTEHPERIITKKRIDQKD